MAEARRSCFVLMPFSPELHYFYLYLRQHLERRFNLACERADARVLTVPILEKIRKAIERADVIIADTSSRNPNVFYELGIAHQLGKPVILITSDPVRDASSDVRHFEFIPYRLDDDVSFLARIENAVINVFAEIYQPLYAESVGLHAAFRRATGERSPVAAREVFVARVMLAEKDQPIPSPADVRAFAAFVLPLVVAEPSLGETVLRIAAWVNGLPEPDDG